MARVTKRVGPAEEVTAKIVVGDIEPTASLEVIIKDYWCTAATVTAPGEEYCMSCPEGYYAIGGGGGWDRSADGTRYCRYFTCDEPPGTICAFSLLFADSIHCIGPVDIIEVSAGAGDCF